MIDFDFYYTNEDCRRCCNSMVVSICTDYEEHEWRCTIGYVIEAVEDDKKPCGLLKGEYYIPVKNKE